MGLPKHLSTLGVAERTARDKIREADQDTLRAMWGRVDADIADALGEAAPDKEPPDGQRAEHR